MFLRCRAFQIRLTVRQNAFAQKLGISQMHVSRLQLSALNKLKSSLAKQASS